MIDFIITFVNLHPWIASVLGVIIIFLGGVAVIGLVQFIIWLHSVSEIASAIVILFSLLVISVWVMITA